MCPRPPLQAQKKTRLYVFPSTPFPVPHRSPQHAATSQKARCRQNAYALSINAFCLHPFTQRAPFPPTQNHPFLHTAPFPKPTHITLPSPFVFVSFRAVTRPSIDCRRTGTPGSNSSPASYDGKTHSGPRRLPLPLNPRHPVRDAEPGGIEPPGPAGQTARLRKETFAKASSLSEQRDPGDGYGKDRHVKRTEHRPTENKTINLQTPAPGDPLPGEPR